MSQFFFLHDKDKEICQHHSLSLTVRNITKEILVFHCPSCPVIITKKVLINSQIFFFFFNCETTVKKLTFL